MSDQKPITDAAPALGRRRLVAWLMATGVVLVTIVSYWPAIDHGFVNYDDDVHVTRNYQVQRGLTLESMKWAFLNPVNCNWHPMTVLSHMLDCQLFGLHPWGHHLTNVLLHALNAMLVFVLFQQMTGARWPSLLVATLFSVHPLRIESVAWVAERKDVLSSCFGLLALLLYVRYAQRSVISNQWSVISNQSPRVPATNNGPRTREHRLLMTDHRSLFYLLSLGCFACGLMSKPTLVTWPFILLLLDYWPLRRFERSTVWRLITEKVPFFALAAAISVITFMVQKKAGAVELVRYLPLGARSANGLVSYCRYVGKLFWPTDLAVFYPYPGHWPLATVLLAAGLLLGISALLWAQRHRFPFLLMGWLWFGGMLVPMIGLVPTGKWAMADRHTYLPSLGVLILTVWAAYELTQGWRHRGLALTLAGTVAVACCLSLTRQQLGYWQDSEALFRHSLHVTGPNWLACNNLGAALANKGQTKAAIPAFEEALRLDPNFATAHFSFGTVLGEMGQMDEAIGHFQEAIRLQPDYADAHHNLGVAFMKRGQLDQAISHLQETIKLSPDNPLARNNLGSALAQNGRIDEAISQYRESIRLDPNDVQAHNWLGVALVMRGLIGEAINQYEAGLHLDPSDADVHNNLGYALSRKGRTEEAISQFQEALRLNPGHADARKNLDSLLAIKAGASR